MKNKVILSIALGLILTGLTLVSLSMGQLPETTTLEATITDPNRVAEPNMVAELPAITDPNQPRKIVMPKGTKLPPRFKCPVHGMVNNSILKIEIDGVIHTFCKKCAMQLVVDIFEQNLPRLIDENKSP